MSIADVEVLTQQVEELRLIRCSLLPEECFAFLLPPEHCSAFESLLDGDILVADTVPIPQVRFQVKLDEYRVSFDVIVPPSYNGLDPSPGRQLPTISTQGQDLTRRQQERWNDVIGEIMGEVGDTEFPIYQLLVLHLLPMLHGNALGNEVTAVTVTPASTEKLEARRFHALLTSHHLISPTKRRLLQQWSGSLSVSGFAKVGYPGVIYGQGTEEDITEFVANIKAMQWLALRVRFVEPLPGDQQVEESRHWLEFQKVGEVVAEMKRLGREECILEMGVGSAGSNSK